MQDSTKMKDADQERDIDAVIRQARQQLPEIKVTQLPKRRANDDDNLWWFSLVGRMQNVQVERSCCPLLIETEEQSSREALKAATVEEAVTMIVTYLLSVKEGRPMRMKGELYWQEGC